MTMRRPFPEGCPSEFALDRFFCKEEMGEAERVAMEGHIRGCETCRARMAEREKLAKECASDPVVAYMIRRAQQEEERPRGWWHMDFLRGWGIRPGLAAAAAACLVVAVVAAVQQIGPSGPEVRIKQPEFFGVYVLGPDGSTSLSAVSGVVFHPGEKVRFSWRFGEEGHVAVYGLDPVQVTQYEPAEGRPPLRVAPGVEDRSKDAFELDATLGLERLVVVFCRQRFDTSEMLVRMREHWAAGGALTVPDGCRTREFLLDKREGIRAR